MAESKKKFKELSSIEQYSFAKKQFLEGKRKKYNFTGNYHLGDGLNDRAFNKRFNKNEDLQKLFFGDTNLTYDFVRALKTRVTNNDHIVLVFFGPTNSGKSWGAIRIAEIIRNLFSKELNNKSELFLSFSDIEYRQQIPEMKEKDIMIRDETPDLSGKGTVTIQKNLNNVLTVTRAGQYCFLFISPDITILKSNAVSFYLESAGINKNDNKSRFILYDRSLTPLGRIFVRRPKNEKFLNSYEKQKSSNIMEIMKSAGGVSFSPDMDKLKTQINVFLGFCREKNVKYKGEIKSLIPFFNEKYPDLMITSLAGGDGDIVNNVFLALRDGKVTKKKERQRKISKIYENPKKFKFDSSGLYKKIKKEVRWRNIERDLEIYDLYINSELTQLDISEKYPSLRSPQAVSAVIEKVKGKIYRTRGKMFEEEYYKYLKSVYDTDPNIIVKYDGGREKPDIIVINKKISELVVLSLKCLRLPIIEKKYPYYIKWRNEKFLGGFEPEISYAGRYINTYKNINVFAVICSAISGKVKSFPFNIQKKKMIKIESEF